MEQERYQQQYKAFVQQAEQRMDTAVRAIVEKVVKR